MHKKKSLLIPTERADKVTPRIGRRRAKCTQQRNVGLLVTILSGLLCVSLTPGQALAAPGADDQAPFEAAQPPTTPTPDDVTPYPYPGEAPSMLPFVAALATFTTAGAIALQRVYRYERPADGPPPDRARRRACADFVGDVALRTAGAGVAVSSGTEAATEEFWPGFVQALFGASALGGAGLATGVITKAERGTWDKCRSKPDPTTSAATPRLWVPGDGPARLEFSAAPAPVAADAPAGVGAPDFGALDGTATGSRWEAGTQPSLSFAESQPVQPMEPLPPELPADDAQTALPAPPARVEPPAEALTALAVGTELLMSPEPGRDLPPLPESIGQPVAAPAVDVGTALSPAPVEFAAAPEAPADPVELTTYAAEPAAPELEVLSTSALATDAAPVNPDVVAAATELPISAAAEQTGLNMATLPYDSGAPVADAAGSFYVSSNPAPVSAPPAASGGGDGFWDGVTNTAGEVSDAVAKVAVPVATAAAAAFVVVTSLGEMTPAGASELGPQDVAPGFLEYVAEDTGGAQRY